jgi:hypothetical protein
MVLLSAYMLFKYMNHSKFKEKNTIIFHFAYVKNLAHVDDIAFILYINGIVVSFASLNPPKFTCTLPCFHFTPIYF